MKYTKAEKEAAAESLREILKPGDTVYTVLRSKSRSGMSRRIDLYTIDPGGVTKPSKVLPKGYSYPPRLRYLSGYAAVLLDIRRSDDGLKVDGCGMDMGFSLVYNLSSVLFPRIDQDGKANDKRGAGYALRQEWI